MSLLSGYQHCVTTQVDITTNNNMYFRVARVSIPSSALSTSGPVHTASAVFLRVTCQEAQKYVAVHSSCVCVCVRACVCVCVMSTCMGHKHLTVGGRSISMSSFSR